MTNLFYALVKGRKVITTTVGTKRNAKSMLKFHKGAELRRVKVTVKRTMR